MKRLKYIACVVAASVSLTSIPFSAAAFGYNDAVRERYEIFKLDLACLDNYIFLHFYETEAYDVFTNIKLCKNSQIQRMYKSLKASLKGDESRDEVYANFEKFIFREVVNKKLTPELMAIFVDSIPETLNKMGVSPEAFVSPEKKEAVIKSLSEKTYTDMEEFVKALKNELGIPVTETAADGADASAVSTENTPAEAVETKAIMSKSTPAVNSVLLGFPKSVGSSLLRALYGIKGGN